MNDSNSVPSDPILPGIKSPADLKALSADQLPALAQEIREEIIAVTSATGGHVGPNLGVVELTIALHMEEGDHDDARTFARAGPRVRARGTAD